MDERGPVRKADDFLERLVAGNDLAGMKTLVVVAHPDDETVGATAVLSRVADVALVHVTDGAPRNMVDGARLGFSTWDIYAAARMAELDDAMAHAGIDQSQRTAMGVPDQGAAFDIPWIAERLRPLLEESDIVVTHAYEGGHPDHDAVALAVHCAGTLTAPHSRAPDIVEMPLYHLGRAGWVRQRFVADEGPPASELTLTPSEQGLKQRMLEAYATQAETLRPFDATTERYRAAPRYDFGTLPNRGALLYERYQWGMTGPQWRQLADAARAHLGPLWPA